MSKPLVVIAGAGAGTGAAFARKFGEMYKVVLLARTPASYEETVSSIVSSGGQAVGIPTDLSSEESVKDTFEEIRSKHGVAEAGLAAAIFNAGGRLKFAPFLETDLKDFEDTVSILGRGAFVFSQLALPLLLSYGKSQTQYPPGLFFMGASASIRGSARCETFSPGKFMIRSLSQSLAREYGPEGVHVGHIVVDGVIDIPRSKNLQINGGVPEGKISPAAIADTVWHMHTQPRSAFTWELDLRPYVEKW